MDSNLFLLRGWTRRSVEHFDSCADSQHIDDRRRLVHLGHLDATGATLLGDASCCGAALWFNGQQQQYRVNFGECLGGDYGGCSAFRGATLYLASTKPRAGRVWSKWALSDTTKTSPAVGFYINRYQEKTINGTPHMTLTGLASGLLMPET
jgi:hypothetical protein